MTTLTKDDYRVRLESLYTKPNRPSSAPPPQNAYGIYLTDSCLLHFGIFFRRYHNIEFDSNNPIHVRASKTFATTQLPLLCLIAVPNLYLSRWKTYLVRTDEGLRNLLVLADDGDEKAKEMKNAPEVVEDLLTFLGLQGQTPAWYPVV